MKDWKTSFIEDLNKICEKKHVKDYDAFVFWYLKQTTDLSEAEIEETITNRSKDGGVDAIVIDKKLKVIKIIQSKYTTSIGEFPFVKDELTKLNHIRDCLQGKRDIEDLKKYVHNFLRRKLDEAIKLMKEDEYSLKLYFITTHKNNPNYSVYANDENPVEIVSARDIQNKYEEWRHGHTPELGEVELSFHNIMEAPPSDKKAYLVNLNTLELRNLYKKFGEKIFDRNVRIFYGDKKPANKNMIATLSKDPDNFWYFNNGITILSPNVAINEKKLVLKDPQIINGCQTVTVLGTTENTKSSFVFAKIVEIGDNLLNQNLIDGIIEANNRQTPVDERMLKSNHPLQVKLKNELESLGFYYERKEKQYDAEKSKSNKIAKLDRIDNLLLVRSNITIIKAPHVAHADEKDLFSQNNFESVFTEGKHFLDYLLPYLVWSEVNYIGKNYRGDDRRRFHKLASWHVLRIIYDNCHDLNNPSKTLTIYRKLHGVEPYKLFELNSKPIKQLFDIAFNRFRRSEYVEKDSGRRDFFKRVKTYDELKESVPKYLKIQLQGLFNE